MTALKGAAILQREHRGTGTRLPALRSPPIGGDLAETTQKSPRSDQKAGVYSSRIRSARYGSLVPALAT